MQWAIIFLGALFISWSIGDYHGHQSEKNSIENKQKSIIIKEQQLSIDKLENTIKIGNNTVRQLINDRIQEHNNYTRVLGELSNDKKIIDSTNHINGLLVRSVRAGINGKSMSQTFDATSRINAESETYSAAAFASAISMIGKQCNDIRNQLILLIQYDIKQVENYNAN